MSLIDDAVLLKMAEAEILGEAKRAAARHSVIGVSGWQPCSKLNKTFLTNTLLQTMASNRILARKKGKNTLPHKKTERKLLKSSKTDKGANFVFKKPNESKEKSRSNTKKECITTKNTSEYKQLKTTNKSKNSNVKKVKIKKS